MLEPQNKQTAENGQGGQEYDHFLVPVEDLQIFEQKEADLESESSTAFAFLQDRFLLVLTGFRGRDGVSLAEGLSEVVRV